ncbi:MAG TPA: phenylalanine--tRNA ligase subunit alpha [Anaeromyxobacteraceae bacterium]|nr:phenylalanine--tRNA ligase subunit alpha [Anaeromyxobacteraceae bacterium]
MADLLAQLEQLATAARRDVAAAADERALEDLRVRFLGKKGELSQVLRGMGTLPAEERPRVGEVVNRVRDEVETLLAAAVKRLGEARLEAELSGPPIDVTLPSRRLLPRGHRHPITRAAGEIAEIFARLGYEVASGPEIESDWYNFEALNIPGDHPARDMQDTFYVDDAALASGPKPGSVLLRTHTSPVQIRAMKRAGRPPVRVICPGRVYRSDYDQTHSPMFHQVEGLCVDQGITFADLKGTLAAFARAYFGPGTRTRFRPSYFPFVEPGAEVDVSCSICGGTGKKDGKRCGTCKETGWLEVLGAGMVHPRVLEFGGMDPRKVTGFAFGMGVERMAMLRYGIDDLRLYFDNDLRFLEQF